MSNIDKGTLKQRIADKINAAKIATRLAEFAQAKPDDKNYASVQMTTAQVNAARILLAKVVPDLKQVEQIVEDRRKKDRKEIDAALMANGVDPKTIWQQVTKH